MKTFFVSSTFRDMDEERDAILQITLPRLNAIARDYGESVSFCDLRWGVDTAALESDEGSQKVLNVCLDEIDRCRPPMVVILGYRYGWLPPGELIEEAARRRRLSLDSLQKSITALEIEYGALPEAANAQTLFYFREFDGDIPAHCASEDAEHFALLRQLKERILRINGGQVKTYRVCWNGQSLEGISDFANTLAEDLEALMLPQWKKNSLLTPWEKEIRAHRDYLEAKAAMFYARNSFAEELVEKIKNGKTRLLIEDVSGSGKSTFFSHLALRLEEEGFTVFPLFCGLTSESCTSADILRKIIFFLEETLHLSHFLEQTENGSISEKRWGQRLEELCLLCREEEGLHIVIMTDAIDQLLEDELRDRLLFLPQELSDSLRLVITCLDSFPSKNVPTCSFPPFEQEEKEDMIRAILNVHHRELSSKVISAMAALPQSDSPLYVSQLIQRMLLMNRQDFDRIRSLGDGMEAIISHQLEILSSCPEELGDLCAMVLEVAGERINSSLVSRAARFLAVSRRGLRLGDLQALLGDDFNMLDFSHFVTYMSDSFILRNDGRYDFSHRSIREGYLQNCEDLQGLHRQLIWHFLSLKEDDPLRKTELVYHMVMCRAGRDLISYIERYEDHEDKSIIRAAASTLFGILRSGREEISWFIPLIQNAAAYGSEQKLVRFLIRDFRPVGTGSEVDVCLVRFTLQAAAMASERLMAQGADLRHELARILYYLPDSMTQGEKDDKSYRRTIVCYHLLSLHLFHELRMENPTARTRMEEARACKRFAYAYRRYGCSVPKELHYIDAGISLAEEALSEEMRRDTLLFLSDCYSARASIYSGISSNPSAARAHALAAHEKNLDCLRRISKAFPQSDNRRAYCIAYRDIGDALAEMGGSEYAVNLQKALNYYNKAYELTCALYKDTRSLDSSRLQAGCCERIADLLSALSRKKYNGQIMEYYNTAEKLYRHILFQLATDDAFQSLGSVYANLGKHRILCDSSPESLKKAVRELHLAIVHYRKLIKVSDSEIKEAVSDIEEIVRQRQSLLAKNLTRPYYDLSLALQKLGREKEADAARQSARQLHSLCVSDEQSYAYAEVLEIMRYMPPQYRQAVPYTVTNIFLNFRDRQYKPHLNSSVPLMEQEVSKKTSALLAVLTVNYMTENDAEEEELLSYSRRIKKFKNRSLIRWMHRPCFNLDAVLRRVSQTGHLDAISGQLKWDMKKRGFVRHTVAGMELVRK